MRDPIAVVIAGAVMGDLAAAFAFSLYVGAHVLALLALHRGDRDAHTQRY
jgi:hypothetical protein